MANYIKVTLPVAIGIGHTDRPRTKDGHVLLWQQDIMRVDVLGFENKIQHIGGARLTPIEAKREMDGTCKQYAQVFTPEEYKQFEPQPEVEPTNESPEDGKEHE